MIRQCRVTKYFGFESAHQLPNHGGKCRHLHGHSYKLEVVVSGDVNPQTGLSNEGMVIDFSELSAMVKSYIIDVVDHKFLNDVLPDQFQPTTAENISAWIFNQLVHHLDDGNVQLEAIRLWETATSCCEFTREMWDN